MPFHPLGKLAGERERESERAREREREIERERERAAGHATSNWAAPVGTHGHEDIELLQKDAQYLLHTIPAMPQCNLLSLEEARGGLAFERQAPSGRRRLLSSDRQMFPASADISMLSSNLNREATSESLMHFNVSLKTLRSVSE